MVSESIQCDSILSIDNFARFVRRAVTHKKHHLKMVVGCGHIDGPPEFVTLRFVVDLFDRNIVFLAPEESNSRQLEI